MRSTPLLVVAVTLVALSAGCARPSGVETSGPLDPTARAEPLSNATVASTNASAPSDRNATSQPAPASANATSTTNGTSGTTASAATVYHDEAEYAAGVGAVLPDAHACRDAANPPPASPADQVTRHPGGVCWKVPAGATLVQNLLVTDVDPHDILASLAQMDASGTTIKTLVFCTHATNVPLDPAAKTVSVVVGAGDASTCPPIPGGATGLISIRFT